MSKQTTLESLITPAIVFAMTEAILKDATPSWKIEYGTDGNAKPSFKTTTRP